MIVNGAAVVALTEFELTPIVDVVVLYVLIEYVKPVPDDVSTTAIQFGVCVNNPDLKVVPVKSIPVTEKLVSHPGGVTLLTIPVADTLALNVLGLVPAPGSILP